MKLQLLLSKRDASKLGTSGHTEDAKNQVGRSHQPVKLLQMGHGDGGLMARMDGAPMARSVSTDYNRCRPD